jgi:hypothetical protein
MEYFLDVPVLASFSQVVKKHGPAHLPAIQGNVKSKSLVINPRIHCTK